jgi:hypothetical protein
MPPASRSWTTPLAGLILLGCGATDIRGGATAKPERVEQKGPVSHYLIEACRDAKGTLWPHDGAVQVFQDADGNSALMETRPGYDALVVFNHHLDKGERVFQVITQSESGTAILHDYRLPADGGGAGRLALARRFHERELESGGFAATPEQPELACSLRPGGRTSAKPGPRAVAGATLPE